MIELDIPHPKEIFNQQILNSIENFNYRVEVYYGGASSGKSQGVYQKVVIKAMMDWNIPRRILIMRKVGKSIRESCYQHIKDVLSEFQLLEYCKVSKSDFTIELPNGAMFIFLGLDDPEKIKSIKGISDIVMEEATEFNLDDFTQLNLRLRDAKHLNKQLYILFNPVSKKNWVFQYFFNENGTLKDDSEWIVYWSTYKDNKFLDQVTIDQIEKLKLRNPAYYKIYALGEFATLDKLVFPTYTKRLISPDEVLGLMKWQGLDFGYTNDPSALTWGYIDQINKKIYVTGEYVRHGMLNSHIAETIISLGMHKDKTYADSQEPKSIQEIKNGIEIEGNIININIDSATKGKDSVIHGLQWLLQYEIIIDERCFKTIEEFDNYTWKKDKKTNEYFNEPVDTFNHTIDSIRYGLNKYIMAIDDRVVVLEHFL